MVTPWKHWGNDKKEGNEDFYQPAAGRGSVSCCVICGDARRAQTPADTGGAQSVPSQPQLHGSRDAGTASPTPPCAVLAAFFHWFGRGRVDQSSVKELHSNCNAFMQ